MMRTSGAIRAVNQVSDFADGDSMRWRRSPVTRRADMFIKVQVTSLHHCISQWRRLVSGIKHRSHYWSASRENQSLTGLARLKNECNLYCEKESLRTHTAISLILTLYICIHPARAVANLIVMYVESANIQIIHVKREGCLCRSTDLMSSFRLG